MTPIGRNLILVRIVLHIDNSLTKAPNDPIKLGDHNITYKAMGKDGIAQGWDSLYEGRWWYADGLVITFECFDNPIKPNPGSNPFDPKFSCPFNFKNALVGLRDHRIPDSLLTQLEDELDKIAPEE